MTMQREELPPFSFHRPHSALRICEQTYQQAFVKLNQAPETKASGENKEQRRLQKEFPDLITSQQIYEQAVILQLKTQKATLVQILPRRLKAAELDGGWTTWGTKGSNPLPRPERESEEVYEFYESLPSMEVKTEKEAVKGGKEWERRAWMGAEWDEIDLTASSVVFSPSTSEVGEFKTLVRGEEGEVDALPEDQMIELEDLEDSSDDDAHAILSKLPSLPSLKEASFWSEGDWQAYLMSFAL